MTRLALLGVVLLSIQSNAAEFNQIESCGNAKVVSGDTCSNVKVEFSFEGCPVESEPTLAKRIICDKLEIKARLQEKDYRFEAIFKKNDSGWGGVTWSPIGKVSLFKKATAPVIAKKQFVSDSKPEASVEKKPASAEAVAGPAPSSTAFKFGGFVDIRHSIYNRPNIGTGNPESGFGIEDGALFVNFEKNSLSAFVDLAFRRGKDSDTNSAATNPTQSSNSTIAIGIDKSQVFLKYKRDSFGLLVGQFDTIFGVELNDSKDRIFGKTGLVYDYTLPVTHTGAMLDWGSSGFYAKAFAANPNNKGSYGSSTSGDDRTEYGGAFGYSNDLLHGQIGYMTRPIYRANSISTGDRTLADATFGMVLGKLSFDLEYNRVSDPNKNKLTPGDNTDFEVAGQGFLLLASYRIVDSLLIAGRYESIVDDPSAGSLRWVNSAGGSIHYSVEEGLELRGEYNNYNFLDTSNTGYSESRYNVAAVLTL